MLTFLTICTAIAVLYAITHISVNETENLAIEHQSEWPTANDERLAREVGRAIRIADRFPLAGGATGEGGVSRSAPFTPLFETSHTKDNSRG